jgi:ATP-dependent DNA helicase RecG
VFRRELPEYPLEALREHWQCRCHRDYSYMSGAATFRFVCLPIGWNPSPGGLFGNVTVENLEEEHSTRNARLMRMMKICTL